MNRRTITVRGSARVTEVPDWVVISFDVISKNYEYEKCMEQLAVKTESLHKELASVGLEKESLKTAQFDIDTDFDRSGNRYVFKGYKASHNMRVEFPFEKNYLNKVLGVLSRTHSQAAFRVTFQVKDPEPLRQKAIAEAVKNAKEKAKVLAEAAGVSLGEIVHIDYNWSEIYYQPNAHVKEIQATVLEPNFDLNPEDVNVSDSVTVNWSIE